MSDARDAADRARTRRNTHRRLRRAKGFCLALAGAALLYGVADSPLFWVEAVTIEAPTAELRDEVCRRLRVPAELSAVTGDLRVLARQAEAVPEVGRVEIHRRLPRRLAIAVTRRVAIAGFEGPRGVWLADAEGRLLRHMSQPPAGMPRVKGIDLSSARPGWYLNGARYAVASECVQWARRLAPLREAVVDVSRVGRIVVKAGRVQGRLGHPRDLGKKLVILASSVQELPGAGALEVDLRDPAHPTWLSVAQR